MNILKDRLINSRHVVNYLNSLDISSDRFVITYEKYKKIYIANNNKIVIINLNVKFYNQLTKISIYNKLVDANIIKPNKPENASNESDNINDRDDDSKFETLLQNFK